MHPYPWQMSQWQNLLSAFKANTNSHAFLLSGTKGLGKKDFSLALANWILCDSKEQDQACGQCTSCLWMKSETHPDFFHLGASDQNTIKIDAIRELTEQLYQTSAHSKHQVVLIEPAEAMNISAMNALLKTLEEPSGLVIFILVTHQPSRIPLTILSRAQAIRFHAPKKEESEKWLLEHKIPPQDIDYLLSITGGLPLKTLKLFEKNELLLERETLFEFLLLLLQQKMIPTQAAEKVLKFDLEFVFHNLTLVVMDLMRLSMGTKRGNLTHQDKETVLSEMQQQISFRALIIYQHQLRENLRLYQNHPNLNKQLLLEKILIQWRKMCL